MNFHKIEHRAITKFLTSENCASTEIRERLVKYSGTDAPSLETIRRWTLEFKRGRTSLEDDHRPGRPISVTCEQNVLKVQDIVKSNRRLKSSQVASAFRKVVYEKFILKTWSEKNLCAVGSSIFN